MLPLLAFALRPPPSPAPRWRAVSRRQVEEEIHKKINSHCFPPNRAIDLIDEPVVKMEIPSNASAVNHLNGETEQPCMELSIKQDQSKRAQWRLKSIRQEIVSLPMQQEVLQRVREKERVDVRSVHNGKEQLDRPSTEVDKITNCTTRPLPA